MGKFDGCLLASDVDGTLLSSGYLPERNIKAIEYFAAEGGHFSLATGRTLGAVGMVTRQIKPLSPSITGNGSVIYDYENEKIVHALCLSDQTKKAILELKNKFPKLGIEIHNGEQVFVLTRSDATDEHESYEELVAEERSFEALFPLVWNKALLAFVDDDERIAVTEYINSINFFCDTIGTTAEISGNLRHYFEFLPVGCSKATALKELKKILKIQEGHCFAIGDYFNDLEMIKAADISAVPEGSPEELKSVATTVVGPVENGAVADFILYIEKLLEKERN